MMTNGNTFSVYGVLSQLIEICGPVEINSTLLSVCTSEICVQLGDVITNIFLPTGTEFCVCMSQICEREIILSWFFDSTVSAGTEILFRINSCDFNFDF